MHEIVTQQFDCYSSLELMMRDTLADNRENIKSKLYALCDNYNYVVDIHGDLEEWWAPCNCIMQDELRLTVTLNIKHDICTLVVTKDE